MIRLSSGISLCLCLGLNAFSVSAAEVVLNEIMFHPASGDSSREYVELHNLNSESVNLEGWRLEGGVTFTFPATVLPADGFLVVAADVSAFRATYPETEPLVGDWDGQLSNRREQLRLKNAQDDLIDEVTYADQGDWAVRRRIMDNVEEPGWHWESAADGSGKSLERVNPHLHNDSGQNWAFSAPDGGTPGSANSNLKKNVAPLITETTHFPVIPDSTQQVYVTSRIWDETLSDATTVTLHYRTDADPPNPFSTINMSDDGLHQDAQPGDGLYGGAIPPQPDGTIVDFYLQAADEQGNRRTWPAPAQLEDGTMAQQANLLYQVLDTADTGARPLYRLVLKEADRAVLQHQGFVQNATFISQDGTGLKQRYRVSVRIRGHGSRYRLPKSYRVNFARDRPWKGVVALNLNTQYSYLQVLGSAVCQMAGLHAGNSSAVRVLLNNEDFSPTGIHPGLTFGRYAANEVLNSDYADRHFPGDGGGNVYRGIRDQAPANFGYRGDDPEAYQNSYFKRSNTSEDDWSDLIELTRVLSTAPEESYPEAIREVIHLDDWIRHLAVMALMNNQESGINTGVGDDYYLYSGEEDPRFYLLPYDLDTLFGQGGGSGRTDATLFGAAGIPALDRLLKHPEIAPLYYAELNRQIQTTFSETVFNPLVDQVLELFVSPAVPQNIKSWMAARNQYALSQIPREITIETDLETEGNDYVATQSTVSLRGKADIIETRRVLVNGMQADWVAWKGEWSIEELPLVPGFNTVQVRSLDAQGTELETKAITIRYSDGTVDPLDGPLSGETIWTPEGGPYRINNTLSIPQNASLHIEPGTTVYVAPGQDIHVQGRLIAQGTEAAPIHFTLPPGEQDLWGTLRFTDSTGSSELNWVQFQQSGAAGRSLEVLGADLTLNHCTWTDVSGTVLHFENASLTVENCRFPDLNGHHVVTGNGMADGGEVVIRANVFGTTTGPHDILHLSGAEQPASLFHILDNTFVGGADDGVELAGADAYVEGNRFTGFKKNHGEADSAHALVAANGRITLARNVLAECDHAVLLGPGSDLTAQHNTIVHCANAAIQFAQADAGADTGIRALLEGNIIWDNQRLFLGLQESSAELQVRHSLLQGDAPWPGPGNLNSNPLFVDADSDFRLRPGSPAAGAAPRQLDMGAFVPKGAVLSGLPERPTFKDALTLDVGGAGITHYRYQLNDQSASGELPVSQAIELSDLSDGPYQLSLWGKNAADVWEQVPKRYTWNVDSSLSRVIINEVLASNSGTGSFGDDFPDLVELYNESSTPADLSGLGLSDDPQEPYRFVFPEGSTLAPGEYLVLAGGSSPDLETLRLGFSLRQSGEAVYLHDAVTHGGARLDSVTFGRQITDLSIGRLPDGTWGLTVPTFGEANRVQPLRPATSLQINEWLARADQHFEDDYIEIYNPSDLPVNLSGLYLTDRPSLAPDLSKIPSLSFIDSFGSLVFIADGNPEDGPDHLDFRLASDQGLIALFDPNLQRIDQVHYGPQSTDISQGRTPSGHQRIRYLSTPTPGAANPAPNFEIVSQTTEVIGMTGSWRFHQQGENLGFDYLSPGYDDSADGWEEGSGLFYANFDNLPAPKNTELSITDPAQSAIYFRRTFDYDGSVENVSIDLTHLVDDGIWVFLNGIPIYRWNITTSYAYSRTAAFAVVNPITLGPITIPVDNLRQGKNVLGVQLHQYLPTDDALFGLSMSITEKSVQPVLPAVALNELMADNRSVRLPNGRVADWAELYNRSDSPVDLSGMGLTDSLDAPSRWTFPQGTLLPAGQFRLVALDPGSPASEANAGFGLKNEGDSLYLFHRPEAGGQLLDSVQFGWQAADYSLGKHEGDWHLTVPTPGSGNRPASTDNIDQLKINEWLADPQSGDDWLEIYNPGNLPVALSGLFLTDDLEAPLQSPIAHHSFIGTGPDRYRVFVADGDASRGADHVNFKLDGDGESIGLFHSQGNPIDTISFSSQTEGTTQGRYPDGTQSIIDFPATPSPGSANYLDSDGDRMPDSWELTFNLDVLSSEDAEQDPDGDGMSNYAEFLSGTHPRQAQSFLGIKAIEPSEEGMRLQFTVPANRTLLIQHRNDLNTGEWGTIRTVEPQVEPTEMELTDIDLQGSNHYYRLFVPSDP